MNKVAVSGLALAGCQPRSASTSAPTTSTPPADAAPPPPAPPPTSTVASAASALPDGRDAADFKQHTRQPLTLEARPERFGPAPITPNTQFFVRNNLPLPDRLIVDEADAWTVAFTGVKSPRTLSLAELKRMPAHSVTAVIQCSGNGRAFFEHGPSGSQWVTGAAGCATWTGVRVADVVRSLGGVVDEGAFMTSTGGDPLPAGIDRALAVVERSVPAEKGLRDCLLAWSMNGAPLPLSNGGPLRVIVPGYFGVNNIKYVKQVAFTPRETKAKIQKSGYRFRPIGNKGAPTHPSMWRMPVKSWFIGPGSAGEPILPGPRRLTGVALSGERGVRRVDFSTDGGRSWQLAPFVGPDLGPSAWRVFQVPLDLAIGQHRVHTRATDTAGDTQPRQRIENERGYANTSWSDHGVTLNVVAALPDRVAQTPRAEPRTARAPVRLSEAGKRGRALAEKTAQPACGVCHTIDDLGTKGAVGPHLDERRPSEAQVVAAVTQGVGAMPGYKGTLSEAQIADIARYIVEATQR